MRFSPPKAGTGKALGAILLSAIWHKLWEFLKWFCEWIIDKTFGDAVYKWLVDMIGPSKFPFFDILAGWGITAALFVAGLFLFWQSNKYIENPRHGHPQSLKFNHTKSYNWIYVALFAISVVAIIIWRFEYIRSEQLNLSAKANVSRSYIIALNCIFADLPKTPPAEGYINTLRVGSSEVEVLGLSERAAMPDRREWNWAGIDNSYRCDVSNASKFPVTNLSMAIKLHFTKWIKYDPKSELQNKFAESDRIRFIRIPIIMPESRFYFYIYNMEGENVDIDMPDTATIYNTDNSRINVKLIPGQSLSFSLPPFDQKKYINNLDASSKKK